jgi:hypothetical protein
LVASPHFLRLNLVHKQVACQEVVAYFPKRHFKMETKLRSLGSRRGAACIHPEIFCGVTPHDNDAISTTGSKGLQRLRTVGITGIMELNLSVNRLPALPFYQQILWPPASGKRCFMKVDFPVPHYSSSLPNVPFFALTFH